MSIENILAGALTIITMIIVGGVSFYLAKDKSNTPKMVGFIGVMFSIIPLLGILYLIFIAFNMKNKPLLNPDNNQSDKS